MGYRDVQFLLNPKTICIFVKGYNLLVVHLWRNISLNNYFKLPGHLYVNIEQGLEAIFLILIFSCFKMHATITINISL